MSSTPNVNLNPIPVANAVAKNSATSSVMNKLKSSLTIDNIKGFFQGNKGMIIAFGLLLLLFVLVIIYIISQLRNNAYRKNKSLVSQIINLSDRDRQIEISNADLPKQTMGEQFTFSYWLYLEDVVQTPGFHKLIFYRGNKNDIQNANPIVMIDELTNIMYIVLKTRNNSLASTNDIKYENLLPITERNYFENKNFKFTDASVNKYIIVPVTKLPFNVWVHFAVAVKDNVITVYKDGEVYTVKTVDDFILSRPIEHDDAGNAIKYNLNIDKSDGSIFIGRDALIGGGFPVSGFLSKMNYFNYAMTIDDVSKIYRQGAFNKSTFLSAFGLSKYGVRSPLYQLSTVS